MEPIAPVGLALEGGLRFRVDFGSAVVTTDAPPPLGAGLGPDSEQLLMAAVANCLAGSLAFSLRKYRNPELPIHAQAEAQVGPDAQGRLRVRGIDVELRLGVPAAGLRLLERALAQYENHCVVTQSVRAAIPVAVRVVDGDGVVLAG